MTPSRSLPSHSFVAHIMEELRPTLLESWDSMPKDPGDLERWRSANRAKLSPRQEYYRRVMHRVFNVLRVFERINHSDHLLARSPRPHSTRAQPLSRAEWTEYHFGVFTTALGSVTDSCLLLVSDVYQLGFLPRHCTIDLVTTNQRVARSAAARELRSLQKAMQHHQERRNRYLHRGEEADFGELTKSDMLENLRSMTWMHSIGQFNQIDAKILRVAWRLELADLRPHMNAASAAAVEGALKLFTALEQPTRQIGDSLRPPLPNGAG